MKAVRNQLQQVELYEEKLQASLAPYLRHFILFIYMTQDHDIMVWSTNKTYNNNKTMTHGMVKVQQMSFKQRKDIP